MHLIRTTSFELEEFDSGSIPRYAILSHRWTSEEMSFQDMKSNRSTRSLGYEKVRQFCKRAAQDGFKYAWVDTCCIDKESSAELSEAINSMFIWYQQSGICYAYLEDVSPSHDTEELLANFGGSEWFKRGWTLQELIAPPDILFIASDWTDIKWKSALCPLIHDITGIDEGMLRGTSQPQEFSIARRMSWAAGRKTSRVEDMAYCLMGLFDVNMPLLYGEGEKAFIRFQEEIMKDSDDQSLFLWEPNNSVPHMVPRGLLAQSPAEFKESADMLPYHFSKASTPFAATNRGIRLHLPLIKHADGGCTMICECQTDSQLGLQLVGIKMQSIPDRDSQFFRVSHPLIRDISVNALHGGAIKFCAKDSIAGRSVIGTYLMAHQGHNIPWGLLASNLEWKTPTPWNNFATNLYPRMKSNQAKDLTHFVNAFVRTLDEHSVCERKKYPKHYDIPEPSDVILDDTIVRKISPTVRRWRNNWPKAKTCPSGTCKKFEVVRETPMGMKRTELIGRCRCIPIPQEERVMPAFLRDPHVEIDWRYSGDDSNAEAIFNIKYVFTLLLYGEMEPILRVCAHPGNHLKFWFTGSYFEGDLGWIQICRHMLSVYNNIAGLYGGVAIREFLSLYRPEDCSYVAASSEVDEVRSILCSMGLPVELALETMKFANYKTPKGKLDPSHDPLHPANREALGQYLKYCWTEIGMDPVDRMEHADRDEGINWANLVGDAIIDLFGHHKDRREGRWHELNFDGQKLPRVWYKKEGVSDDETPFGWRGPYTIFV